MHHVGKVIAVEIKILKSIPVQWSITVYGIVNSGGWSNPGLYPRFYIDFPQDGILDLDFMAMPPDGIAIQPILPIVAQIVWPNPPDYVKGVRIHSASNHLESLVSDASTLTI